MDTRKDTFKCTCQGVIAGEYSNQMWVHAPDHMPKDTGYCLDRCVAEEVILLWAIGITTTGCCCGHGYLPSYIGVDEKDITRMKEMGYQVQPNRLYPEREDGFVPLGHDHLLKYCFPDVDRNEKL